MAKGPAEPAQTLAPGKANQQIVQAYGQLPMSFEANQGQADSQVKFLARGRGYALFLTADEAVLALRQGRPKVETHPETKTGFRPHDHSGAMPSEEADQAVVRMKLLGSNPASGVAGLEQLPGKINYFIGNDPAKWRTNIPTYAKVRYAGVYPGVDLVYYGNQGQLEYDLVVGPGADPNQIKLAFEGTDDIERDAEGNLILRTDGGTLQLKKPLVYQDVNGTKQLIAAQYVLHPQDRIAAIAVEVQVAAYDASKPLIIDPVLVYSTYLGGSAEDGTVVPGAGHPSSMNLNIAVDGSGNAYLTMTTYSTDFPATIGPAYAGTGDAVVARLSNTGSSLLCATYFGGSGYDEGHGIALDSIGNAYVTGRTESADFPVTSGAFDTTFVPAFAGDSKAHLSKFNTSCGPVYITYLGGTVYEWGHGIAVDGVGNVYVTGGTVSPDFPTTAGAFDTTCGTDGACNPTVIGPDTVTFADAYVVKLRPDPTGPTPDPSDLLYSTYLGGSLAESGLGVFADGSGKVYVTGMTISADFPTLGAFDSACGTDGTCNDGVQDGLVVKINPAGGGAGDLLYSTYLGGSGIDLPVDVGVDSSGHAYIAGRVTSDDFPTTAGAYDTTFNGVQDEVLVKLNPSTTGAASLVYSTYLGGSGDDDGHNIAVDGAGNIYTNGGTTSADFPTTSDALSTTLNGSTDAYVVKLRPDGLGAADLKFSTYLGGSGMDRGHGVDVDSAGNIYTAGQTSSPFPVTPGAYDTSYNGGTSDVVVGKICPDPPATPNSFIATGSLSAPRSESSPIATLLSDGRVLVEGGQSPATTASAELYDPTTGTWGSTGSMSVTRAAHTATPLADGKVLVAGGDNGPRLDSAELYDPATGTWSPTGSMSTTRAKHAAVLLPNGKVLVAGGVPSPGGSDNALTSAELYDPVAGTWSPTGSMNDPRFHLSTVLLTNGNVLAIGGCQPNDCLNPYSSTEIYDPGTGVWTPTGSMGTARNGQGIAVRLPDGKVLVAGGDSTGSGNTTASAELYDQTTGVWTPTGAMTVARSGHRMTVLSNGMVLATGGANSTGWLSSAELYDRATGLWTATGSMATGRSGHQSILLANGNVLVAGGGNSTGVLPSAELYTPALCGAIPPVITNVNPELVTRGVTPSESITINGLNFIVGATITVGSLSGPTEAGATATATTPFVWVDSTHLEFWWPNTSLPLGLYDVAVTNPVTAGGLSAMPPGTFIVRSASPAADLDLAITDAPDPVAVGELLTYVLTVHNAAGSDVATGVSLNTTVPAGSTFVSVTVSQGSCSGTAAIVCAIGTMANNATVAITLKVAPTTPGSLTLNADVADDGTAPDPNMANNAASASTPVVATAFIVNSNDNANDGACNTTHCSLIEAINAANATAQLDLIHFNISPGGLQTIVPTSPLPTITQPVVIDGTTQPGFAGTPIIELNGVSMGGAVNGLAITGGGSTVRGLVINRFGGIVGGSGISLSGAGGNVIKGNYIGVNPLGTSPAPNFSGISVSSNNNTIGGTAAGTRNVISGNAGSGVLITGAAATGNQVQGNYIGTDASGMVALANAAGVTITGLGVSGNIIGGTTPATGNLISGNIGTGVLIFSSASGNSVQGNIIGLNAAGTGALGNGGHGISVAGSASNNTIGGTTGTTPGGPCTGACNVISGNTFSGIQVANAGSTGNLIQGNYIGTNAAGTAALGNAQLGIFLTGAPSETKIGGIDAGEGNVISGNGAQGIQVTGTGNSVQGNFIGTNAAGTVALPNQSSGVRLAGAGNTIGGSVAGARNVISGNGSDGILIQTAGTTGNVVQGNFIGANATGTAALANGRHGVYLFNGPSNNTIGGTTAAARNVISGNTQNGVVIDSLGTTGNLVQGNLIGTAPDGTSAMPNGSRGVFLTASAAGNTIGGTAAGAGNTIAFNTQDGVILNSTAGTGNAIEANTIFSNGALGIDLVVGTTAGVTPNDPGDADMGANNLQNFPVLTSATSAGLGDVRGTLDSTPNTTFRVDFFLNATCDPSGFGEGQTFLGFINVLTDATGFADVFGTEFGVNLPNGSFITTTATDPAGNTSEFSQCVTVTPGNTPPTITTADQTANEGVQLQFTVTVTDPDAGDTVTVMVSGLPLGATFESATQQVTWTPAPNQGTCPSPYTRCAGTYPVEISADDHVNPPVLKVILITVNDTIVDSDLDGFPNVAIFVYPADNCPTVYNPNQADFDGDGKGDICDTPDQGGDNPTGTTFAGKVTNAAVLSSSPANETSFAQGEPIFITSITTFRRVDATGDGIADPYYAIRPDAFNVFLKVFACNAGQVHPCTETNGTPVYMNHILEAPALHIPSDLIPIPGGTDPCPPGTTQVAAPGTPEDRACQVATVIDVTESRTGFTPSTLTITPTYFNFILDPEYNPVATPERPACTTVADGCYSPIWMGLAEGPALPVQAAGGTEPASVTPAVTVSPSTWDPRWATIPSTGLVDIYLGNLPSPYTVDQIVANQVRLNGSVPPASSEILTSFTGFTGRVLHLRYPQAQAITSLQTLLSRNLVSGEEDALLLTGVLTVDGQPGTAVAVLRATPLVTLQDLSGSAERISVSSNGIQGNLPSGSSASALSADGRYVAFVSLATNLVPGDTNNWPDAFVRDRQTGLTERVSVSSTGAQGNGLSVAVALSGDGRYIAIVSAASNLVPGDTNGQPDVFVRDRQTGQTTRVSVKTGGTQANGASLTAAISADGRYVTFSSSASNLVTGDTNGKSDIFVHDRQTGQTTRVSMKTGGTQANGDSLFPALNGDGRFVTFSSSAGNLVTGDTNGKSDIFVHDRQTGQTTRVSMKTGGTQANGGSLIPALSGDGRYVVFASPATNLVTGDSNSASDIFVHDQQTSQTARVSLAGPGVEANSGSFIPAISADGRLVGFDSTATNLVPGDTNRNSDVFVKANPLP